MRTPLLISALFFCLCARSQERNNLDSLYQEFRMQLNANSYSVGIIKALENRAATNKVAAVYLNLARADQYLFQDKREDAFRSATKAYEAAEDLKCDSLLLRAEYKIGAVYMKFNDLIKALSFFNRALLLTHSVKNLNVLVLLYSDVAILYSYLDRDQLSLEYFLKMEPLVLRSGNKKQLGNVYNNLAINYMDLRDSVKALSYFKKSIAVRNVINDSQGLAQTQNNLGTLYFRWQQYTKALAYYERGFEARKKAGSPHAGVMESMVNIGKTLYKLKQTEKARIILEQARKEALEVGHIEMERRTDEQLLMIYNELGDYKKAFEMQSRYVFIKDSLYGLDKKEEITRLGFESKLREDSLRHTESQRMEALAHEEKERRTSWTRNIFVGGFIGVGVVAFLLFKQVRRIQLANRIIEHQKEEIEIKQKEILDSIHYAKRIQQSLLASETYITRHLKRLTTQKDRTG